jgi:pimeloyl-ACP methyl ester carboxylesterase
VLLMKDRAGVVGGRGVAQMLRRLADAGDARIALIGHSYGAKVVLSALANDPAPRRNVDSVLLLQPALSCFAFTADLGGKPGGYRPALDRVRLPIITTRSDHDVPLTKLFHLAVRRKADLAEAVIAAGQPPSQFAALGGYGPHGVGVDAEWIAMPAVGAPYPLADGHRIIAADGTAFIASHGAVETPETAWSLLSQVRS